MSGSKDILIEQLRERAEKAERFIATADSEWKARAEKAEDERDEARAEREREERLEALGRAIVEASRFFQDADDIALSEDVTIWEDDCHGGDHRTVLIMDDNQHALLADVSEAVATYREETAGVDVRSDEIKELRKRAEKAERFVATADSEWKARAEKAEREFADRLDHLTAAVKRGDVLQARVTELEKRLAASRAIVDDLKSTIRREEVRGDTAIRERDEARAQRDARPDISAEDAAAWVRCIDVSDEPGGAADVVKYRAVNDAIRAHAAKVKPNPTDCPKCGRHDGGLIALGLAELCSSGCHYAQKAVKP